MTAAENAPFQSTSLPDSTTAVETPSHHHPLADLRGAAQLATDATHATTELVEAVHATVQALFRPDSISGQGHTTGLTGWIYHTVRQITLLSGRSTAWALGTIERATGPRPPSNRQARDRLLSVLNGVLGDHLDASDNPLARPFSLHTPEGHRLNVGATRSTGPNTLVVFVHGLCLSDRAWLPTTDRPGHVEALTDAVAGTPVLARYNTGRPIWTNGRALSDSLEELTLGAKGDSRMVLVAHSMGGLVVRSAVRHACRTSASWPDRVTETIYLGTPHQGAVLERAGAWVEKQLRRTPVTTPFASLARLRSRGIQNLRHGATAPHDTASTPDRVENETASDRVLYVAGTLAPHQPAGNTVGDGLVPVSSALNAPHPPPVPNRRVFNRLGHFDLLHAPVVTEHLCQWLSASNSS
jgi:pimeloyl-ACP methyl ester carboxylesterase